jgi:hypothetical protein
VVRQAGRPTSNAAAMWKMYYANKLPTSGIVFTFLFLLAARNLL